MSETETITTTTNDAGLLPEELAEVPSLFNVPCCDKSLIETTRQIVRERYKEKPENFYKFDVDLVLNDDWAVSRFLLRCRLNPERSANLLEAASKFRQEFKMGETKPCDFPAELHEVGALFQYEPDRAGNTTLWMRAKLHRRSSEMNHIIKQFILCVMEQCDKASNGRGVAVIFDLSDCGIKNADPSFLFWLLNSFRNYCPKGLSYILVYNLPWVLSSTCSLAMTWLSSTNRKRLRFIQGEEIFKFIAPESLPDFVPGGICTRNYKFVPEGSMRVHAQPDHKLVPISEKLADKIRESHKKFTIGDEN